VHQRECVQCKSPFASKRSDAKTCSDACRAKKSRRARDPKIGSPERRQSQLAGLNAKYTYRQRGQVRYDLQRLGIVPSKREADPDASSYALAERYPGGGKSGGRPYMGGGQKEFMAFNFCDARRDGSGWIVDGQRYRKANLPSAELDTFYIGGKKFSRRKIAQQKREISVTQHTKGIDKVPTVAEDVTQMLSIANRLAERLCDVCPYCDGRFEKGAKGLHDCVDGPQRLKDLKTVPPLRLASGL
jgi:hypothetical protein